MEGKSIFCFPSISDKLEYVQAKKKWSGGLLMELKMYDKLSFERGLEWRAVWRDGLLVEVIMYGSCWVMYTPVSGL